MMGRLEQDQGQLFYSFCLEEVVPDDHQVRAIASVLDLSWVCGELSPHYPALGRPSAVETGSPSRIGQRSEQDAGGLISVIMAVRRACLPALEPIYGPPTHQDFIGHCT
jgi:hypothetical protein